MSPTARQKEKEESREAQPPRQVRYVGQANARMITKAEWASIGIQVENGTAWTADNNYTVMEDMLNPEQLMLLEGDPEFVFRADDSDNREEYMRLFQKRLSAGSQAVAAGIDHVKGNWKGVLPEVLYQGPAEPPADLVNPEGVNEAMQRAADEADAKLKARAAAEGRG